MERARSVRFCKILIETLLQRKVGNIKVASQKTIDGLDKGLHGICMDVEIEAVTLQDGTEVSDVGVRPDIYDIEPNCKPEDEPRRMRFYTALVDGRSLQSGVKYKDMKDIYTVMITPYDPFGMDSMIYTVHSSFKEYPDMTYENGITTIFLYTRGKKNIPSKKVRDMLYFIEKSTKENAQASEECRELYEMLQEVRHSREAGVRYLKFVEIQEAAKDEGRVEVISILKAHLAGVSDDRIAENYDYTLENVQSIINDFEKEEVLK